ncbi:MAG: translational GTPase TypA, partial [Oligoflexales bacterium]|nr:translational GTPase TypA [Oligoflexales bacterium]
TGLISSEIIGFKKHVGDFVHRTNGSLVSDRMGSATAYALNNLQERGILFVEEHTELYEGMIIGEHAKDNDLNVNGCRPKKLTNVRTTSSDGITILQGIRKMSLEECIEWINEDEWIEVTPKNIRLRKKILPCNQRSVRRDSF